MTLPFHHTVSYDMMKDRTYRITMASHTDEHKSLQVMVSVNEKGYEVYHHGKVVLVTPDLKEAVEFYNQIT